MPGEDDTVAAVALKLPTFWAKNPSFWFTQAESQFVLAKVTTEITKFHHVVRSLDIDTAEQVLSKVNTPREGHEYADLKDALTKAFDRPVRERAARLADMGGLGDRKPSQLLNEMKALLGTESAEHMLFRHHFLANLPDDIRTSLAQVEYATIDEAAAAADKMYREKAITGNTSQFSVAAVSKPGPKAPNRMQSSTPGICYYHERFGSDAKKCRSPCKFSGNFVASQ